MPKSITGFMTQVAKAVVGSQSGTAASPDQKSAARPRVSSQYPTSLGKMPAGNNHLKDAQEDVQMREPRFKPGSSDTTLVPSEQDLECFLQDYGLQDNFSRALVLSQGASVECDQLVQKLSVIADLTHADVKMSFEAQVQFLNIFAVHAADLANNPNVSISAQARQELLGFSSMLQNSYTQIHNLVCNVLEKANQLYEEADVSFKEAVMAIENGTPLSADYLEKAQENDKGVDSAIHETVTRLMNNTQHQPVIVCIGAPVDDYMGTLSDFIDSGPPSHAINAHVSIVGPNQFQVAFINSSYGVNKFHEKISSGEGGKPHYRADSTHILSGEDTHQLLTESLQGSLCYAYSARKGRELFHAMNNEKLLSKFDDGSTPVQSFTVDGAYRHARFAGQAQAQPQGLRHNVQARFQKGPSCSYSCHDRSVDLSLSPAVSKLFKTSFATRVSDIAGKYAHAHTSNILHSSNPIDTAMKAYHIGSMRESIESAHRVPKGAGDRSKRPPTGLI